MKLIRIILIIILIGPLAACMLSGPMGTDSLAQIKNIHATGANPSADSNGLIRSQALQDTALSIGAQAGLSWRANQINKILQAHSKEFDAIFNFNRLMLADHVLPPVLQASERNMKLDGLTTIRLSDQTYIIQNQARFVTTPPNWREYIWMNFKPPEIPPNNMLPKTSIEQKTWRQYVTIGWQQGVQQGDIILRDNLARLTRDVQGMILYRKLLAEGMVSMPFVKKNNLGVTGGGESLRINDQILQITALPQLQVDSNKWHPVMMNTPTDQIVEDDANE